jgi:hypothetical protein
MAEPIIKLITNNDRFMGIAPTGKKLGIS